MIAYLKKRNLNECLDNLKHPSSIQNLVLQIKRFWMNLLYYHEHQYISLSKLKKVMIPEANTLCIKDNLMRLCSEIE